MFFILSKILSFLLYPLFWIFILLLLAVISKKKARLYLLLAFVLCIFFSNPFIADEALRRWEQPITTLKQSDTAYDAGILLGGGMVTLDTKTNRLIFSCNTDRLLQTIWLYKSNHIKKIIVSSGAGNLVFTDMLEASLLNRYLLSIGIPAHDILIDSVSNNTRENAIFTKEIIKKYFHDKSRFLLITSAIHMTRAVACFKKEGINVMPFTTCKITGRRRYQLDHLLLPAAGSFGQWEKLIHEILGYLIYGVMGYI